MAWIRSEKGASESMALPLMILTFVLVAGFLYWLSVTAEPTQVAIVEEDDPADMASGAAVSWDAFGADPQSYAGREISLSRVEISSLLGTQAFWTQLPNETPYLFKMGDQLVTDGMVVAVGDLGDITGMVHMMSDSVLNAWEAAGAFPDPVNRIEAEFATSFFEATTLAVAAPEGG